MLVEQPSATWDDEGIALSALSEHYMEVAVDHVAGWQVSVWLRAAEASALVGAIYEGELELVGAAVMPEVVPPGGVVAVHLKWRTPSGSVGAQETVSVQVLDSAGELVAQSDRVLTPDGRETLATYAILLPETLDDGDFLVTIVVYDPNRLGAPRRLTLDGADCVDIGKVHVESLR